MVAAAAAVLKRLASLSTAARGDARRLCFALRHPAAPTRPTAGTALLMPDVLSPIDLRLPDVLPVIGVVDDLVPLPLAIRWLPGRLPAGSVADAAASARRR